MTPFALHLEQLAAAGWRVSVAGPLALAGESPDAQPTPCTSLERCDWVCDKCFSRTVATVNGGRRMCREHAQRYSVAGYTVTWDPATRYHVTWVADAIAPVDATYDSEREVCVALEAALRGFVAGKQAGIDSGKQTLADTLDAVFPSTAKANESEA